MLFLLQYLIIHRAIPNKIKCHVRLNMPHQYLQSVSYVVKQCKQRKEKKVEKERPSEQLQHSPRSFLVIVSLR